MLQVFDFYCFVRVFYSKVKDPDFIGAGFVDMPYRVTDAHEQRTLRASGKRDASGSLCDQVNMAAHDDVCAYGTRRDPCWKNCAAGTGGGALADAEIVCVHSIFFLPFAKPVTSRPFFQHTMQKPSLSQDELVAALTGPDPGRRDLALRRLFDDATLREKTIAHVRKYGGNRQDGEDVFQEAILLFDRKLRLGAYRGEGSVEAYFMGIVRWHWFNEQHKTGNLHTNTVENTPEPPPAGDPELEYLLSERRAQLQSLINQLTDKCRKLLKWYQLDYSMDEIARQMGFANGGVAKKEASLCRKRLKILLEKDPDYSFEF